jgi:hypothetical protein
MVSRLCARYDCRGSHPRSSGAYRVSAGSAASSSAVVASPATPTNWAPSGGGAIASHSPSVSKLCHENSTKVPPQSRPSGSTAYLLRSGDCDVAAVDNEPRNAERRSEQLGYTIANSIPLCRISDFELRISDWGLRGHGQRGWEYTCIPSICRESRRRITHVVILPSMRVFGLRGRLAAEVAARPTGLEAGAQGCHFAVVLANGG